MLPALSVSLSDLIILFCTVWLSRRYPLTMLALALITLGLMTLYFTPLDIYLSVLPLALTGCGCGILLFQYQQHCEKSRSDAHSPRTYSRSSEALPHSRPR